MFPSSMDPSLDPAELEARAAEAEAFLRSIASRHRLMILCSLLAGEMQVGELVRRLGLSQSNLSQHLAKLRQEGLVATRREGTAIHYRIGSDRVRPILVELYRSFCAETGCPAGTSG
ncbi:ArsR/SmtB family transcription factor [Azospirillum rugosum]|uniref:DNA-binding transcriptional ArsR family regulator n=1 Tax=Azospirillum rugosum TaxID=416170 RepID=A0ABS4SL91_9PROT|nr:metalloregulator ArsR/SmtB family transcription factor [Azospirillum rugosum]MBP2293323.1 DNA-binding transcriptional ArsR family regulator [Azospirillum rugosum]